MKKECSIFILVATAINFALSFPIGVNLSPLGGNVRYANFDPVSTYAFVDIFKHCSTPFDYRSTNNNGVSWNYVNPASIKLMRNGYPASLPYGNKNNYQMANCDIGKGGNFLKNGTYAVFWSGDGDIGFNAASATISSYAKNRAMIRIHAPPNIGLNVRILRSNITAPVANVNIVPIAFTSNYTTQIFQPDFLNVIRKYNHIRFTGWQKQTNTNPRLWSVRTLPTSSSQHSPEGVALEHMIDLIRLSGVTSAWFSFPLQSTNYTTNFLQVLASKLPTLNRSLKLYIEAGCPEVYGDSDRHVESLALFASAQSIFSNINNVQIVPSASIANIAYVNYLIMWYGSSISSLKAIGVPAQFGRSAQSWDHYNSYGQWDLTYANYTVPQVLEEIRRSSYVGEQSVNYMRHSFFSKLNDYELVAYTGGSYFSAGTWGYRGGLNSIKGCAANNKFPCVWANAQYNFANQSQVDAAMPKMLANAAKEQVVDDLLIAAQRSPVIYDIYLDFLRRWENIGGGLFVSNLLIKPAVRCLDGSSGCGNEGLFEDPTSFAGCLQAHGASPCQKFNPLIDYAAGIRSRLPYTAADITPPVVPTTCSSSNCKWGTCLDGVCNCFAGYSGSDCSTLMPSPNRLNQCNNNTGVNLNGINDWSTEWAFVDIFLHSRAWISQDFTASAWSTGTKQNLLINGYPASLMKNQKIGAMMVRDLRGHMRSGTFVCLYDGDGIITFSMDILSIKRDMPGRIEVNFKPSTGLNNGIFLIIERTNPADPVRNIRLIMPGYETKYKAIPFHPLFLDKLKMYQTIRFMDWQNTNGVHLGQWADRTMIGVNTRSFASSAEINGVSGGGGFGVSIEYMILLSNMLGTNAWFNMPHLATDEYVRNFARMVNSTLRPDVKVYIEYSNEVWGTLFDGGKYAQTRGMNMSLATNAAQARFCFNLLRSNQIFQIWKDVFGASQTMKRLEFVLGSQAVNPDVTRQLLGTCATVKIMQLQTAIAIAPYFGQYTPNVDKNLQIFLNATLPKQIASLSTQVSGHNAVAKQYKLKLITYESGQGLAGLGNTNDLSIQANRNPAMTGLYQSYYSLLQQNGVQLNMAFTSTAIHDYNQCWGTIESSDQDPASAPKFMGIMNYIESHKTCSNAVYNQLKAQARPYTCQNDCSGGGLCVGPDQCECYYGYSGKFCQVVSYTEHVDLCGYKCTFDQGTCVPSKVVGLDRYWSCQCNANYYGPQCSLFSCPNNCTYNGQCLDANVCKCYPGFKGSSCEIDCGCEGHGMCNPNKDSSATCLCDVGWTWSDSSKSCVPACNVNANVFDLSHDPSTVRTSCVSAGQPSCSSGCQYGTCMEGECRCWAGYTGADCSVLNTLAKPNANSLVGMNLGGITYYSPELAFVDVFKSSSAWTSVWADGWTLENTYAWGNGQEINLLPNGYPAFLLPGQYLVKLMLRDIHQHAPSGRYVCLYDGDGEIDFGMDSKVAAIGKGRIEFDFNPTQVVGCTSAYCSDNGIYLRLKKTNPKNPIQNIRVIMPGFENTYAQQPFYPYFLESIQHYKVVRFKDWQHTDGSPVVSWNNRTTLQDVTQTTGVAIELMIQLVNQLGIDPWFCMPHQADDNYVRQFAVMVKRNVRSDVTVYVEYSNEVWNTLFQQGTWAQQQGLKLKLAADGTTAGYRFFAQRSSQMFAIWKAVFADSSIPSFGSSSQKLGLVRVMSTFSISPYASNTILSWMKSVGGEADALGITGYFDCGGVGNANKVATTALMTVNQLLTTCVNDLPNVLASMKQQLAIAKQYNLTIQTYEAGQALVEYNVMAYGNGETPGLTNLFIAANRDAGMGNVYKTYLDTFIANGFMGKKNPLMHFSSCINPTKYGSWGILEYTGQKIETAPKYMALRQYFTSGNALPALVPIAQDTSCFVCVGGCGNEGGLSLNIDYFHQYPGVMSPRKGSVWIAGNEQSISWPVPPDGNYIGQNVSIWLWKNAYCGLNGRSSAAHGGQLVATIVGPSSSLPFRRGVYTYTPPTTTSYDGTASYFIELRGENSHSLFSEFFTIRNTFALAAQDCSSCSIYSASNYKTTLNQGSLWERSGHIENMNCLGEYNSMKPSFTLTNCFTTKTMCTNVRVLKNFKPIIDCVPSISAYPNLALLNTSTWTTQSQVDYRTWLKYLGYTAVTGTSKVCASYNTTDIAKGCKSVSPTTIPTRRPSVTPTIIPTVAPTRVPSKVPTTRPSTVPTAIPTKNPSARPTVIPTAIPTKFPTGRPSVTPTTIPTKVPTVVPTVVPSVRPTVTPTATPTRTPTRKPSVTPTVVPTRVPTVRPSVVPTAMPTKSPTGRPSARPTAIPTKVPTAVPTTIPSVRPTVRPSYRPSVLPTVIPTAVPSVRPTVVPTKMPSIRPSAVPSVKPTALPTVRPSATPTARPSAVPTRVPTATPTVKPTAVPTKTPTVMPTKVPTLRPSLRPTVRPSAIPTNIPTKTPTKTPSLRPSVVPSRVPTASPTVKPSAVPTHLPTQRPSVRPTALPTKLPTRIPTVRPSITPTRLPTAVPTVMPTRIPTVKPSVVPTKLPTRTPTRTSTAIPSLRPSTVKPSSTPTKIPTRTPTTTPSVRPTVKPTVVPTVTPTMLRSATPSKAPTRTPTV